MARLGYRQIGSPNGALANLEDFVNHTTSMQGYWITYSNGYTVYQVLSYSTIIAIYDPAKSTVYWNERDYSNTTARQQTLVRAWLAYRHRSYEVPCADDHTIIRVWKSECAERGREISPIPA